jgi:hypothetical protein
MCIHTPRSDHSRTFRSPNRYLEILWFAFFLLFVWTLITASRLFICSKINDEKGRHLVYLTRLLSVSSSIQDAHERAHFVKTVDNAIQSVKASSDTTTYSVLGVDGTSTNVYYLVTYVITGISLVVTAVYGLDTDSISDIV